MNICLAKNVDEKILRMKYTCAVFIKEIRPDVKYGNIR